MHRIIKYILTLMLLFTVAFFSGCDLSGDDDDSDNPDGDGNDGGIEQLLPPDSEIVQLENGIAVEGYIESEKEEDWYKINAYAGQMLNITLTMNGSDGGLIDSGQLGIPTDTISSNTEEGYRVTISIPAASLLAQ